MSLVSSAARLRCDNPIAVWPMRRSYGYTDAEMSALVGRLGAAAPPFHVIDGRALESELVSIMTSIGLALLTDADTAFAEQVKRRAFKAATGRAPADQHELAAAAAQIVPTRIAKVRARLYEAIAAADPVTLPAAVDAAIAHDDIVVTELRAGLRCKDLVRQQAPRPPIFTLSDLAAYGLSIEPSLLRAAAERLALYYRSWVRAGQPIKVAQWTILPMLADAFLRFTGSSEGPRDLPHAERSNFIIFAHLALQPFVSTTEASVGALSKAWRRIKAHDATDGI